ncbi:hypothetical protein CAEBREN_01428 [Caenorhabditis brenneri]|uniref:Uncharacterized protein n=1 Tax=Caenorhabditis brenneri TaxID=135651 RepID=G0P1G8_CAEBE|nr:hypothetical protein CAEBREN_01428 [Caenorhabditis brenneri]
MGKSDFGNGKRSGFGSSLYFKVNVNGISGYLHFGISRYVLLIFFFSAPSTTKLLIGMRTL